LERFASAMTPQGLPRRKKVLDRRPPKGASSEGIKELEDERAEEDRDAAKGWREKKKRKERPACFIGGDRLRGRGGGGTTREERVVRERGG